MEVKYLRQKDIADRYGYTKASVYRLIKDMEKTGRYPAGAILRTSRAVMVLETAVHDYLKEAVNLENGFPVEPFNSERTKKELTALIG